MIEKWNLEWHTNFSITILITTCSMNYERPGELWYELSHGVWNLLQRRYSLLQPFNRAYFLTFFVLLLFFFFSRNILQLSLGYAKMIHVDMAFCLQVINKWIEFHFFFLLFIVPFFNLLFLFHSLHPFSLDPSLFLHLLHSICLAFIISFITIL